MRCLLAGWFWLVLTAVGAFPSRVWPGRRWAGIHPQALPQADLQALTHFYNSLTGRIQAFSPLSPPKVLFYSCGPTVYDYAHIGNLRAFLTYDLIKRWLLYCGYDVDHVCNLTDVDDKILHRMEVEEASLQEITQKYIDAFHQDLQALNILPANRYPKATEHIDDMLHMTNSLVSKGFAYTQLGSVYFNLSAFPSYGQLVSRQKSMLVGDAPHEACGKAHPHDFALWKAASNSSVSWDSPYGRGRPGWHLECSAMAHRWLGPSIDIHSGGEDLKFPHHCNEIAQSEACSGKQLSRFWMHNAFVITKQEKMSKSRHNFVTLRYRPQRAPDSAIAKDIAHTALDLRSFRLLVLSSQYRNPLSVSSEALHATRKRIERMDRAVHALQRHLVDGDEEGGSSDVDEAVHQFERAMANDLNTPQATVSYFQLIKLAERECALTAPSPARIRQLWAEIQRVDRVLGLLYSPAVSTPASDSEWEEARRMAEQRLVLKQQQRFREADELREKLRERGYTVQDGRDGYTLSATGTRQTSMAAQ